MTDRKWGARIGRMRDQWRQDWRDASRRRQTILRSAGAVAFVLGITILLSWNALGADGSVSLAVGDIAPEDVRAPYSLSYVSEQLTQQALTQAEAGVGPIYDPPDPNVLRQQIVLLQEILVYIDDVRLDTFATPEQKIADLGQVTALTLPDTVRFTLVGLDEPTWQLVALESQSVLERVMREAIREQDLPQVIATLPTQASVRFTPEQSAVISAIVGDLIRPNSSINVGATEAARANAVAAVEPVSRSFERGQVIVRAGERVDSLDSEALGELGLLNIPNLQVQALVRGLVSGIVLLIVISLYLRRVQPDLLVDVSRLLLLEFILLATLLAMRMVAPTGQVVFVPAAVIGMVFVSLTTPATAVAASFVGAIAGAMIADDALEYAVYIALSSSVGALLIHSTDRITRYFFAGLVIGLINAVVVGLFRMDLVQAGQTAELGMLMAVGLLAGVTVAISALAIIYALTVIFNLPTSLKLIELSQPNHPLLQRLLREAPGTYQHALQVANLSEQAANAVGANSELVRVSALYHDVGKVMNPMFFVENQAEMVNPHDTLDDPYRSASIIISHVPDGDRLARQHRLPAQVRDFIWQHHGTTRVGFFYNRAVEQAGDPEAVDVASFTYPGPRPQTREAAIMMLADSSESTVRARKPSSRPEIAEIIQQIIDARIAEGQLDESALTLRDLRTIHRVFVEVLQGVFHPRINYPALATRRTTAELPAIKPAALTTPAAPLLPVEEDTPLADVPPLKRTRQVEPVVASPKDAQEMTPPSMRGEDE